MPIYFRNPDRYRSVVAETELRHFSWDLGHISRQRIDIIKWANLFLSNKDKWEMLVVAREGVAEYNNTSKKVNFPVAVYPTWHPDEGFDALESYCKNPVGEDKKLCADKSIELRFRPVLGQPNRVVIYSPPDIRRKEGGATLGRIMQIARRYPNAELIVHDTASFRLMFSTKFAGATFDPYQTARKGSIIMPSGSAYAEGDWVRNRKWINMLGFNVNMLRGEEALHQRLLFNIESVHWAEQNFNKNIEFSIIARTGANPDTKHGKYEVDEVKESWLTSGVKRTSLLLGPGDGYACDNCSISNKCKFYREGMVCAVSKGKAVDLAKMFGSRDASLIIDGLVRLTEIQAGRIDEDLKKEESTGERMMETDKRIKDLFDSGTKVAKLIAPTLNGPGTTVNIGVIGGAVSVSQISPQQMMADAVRALEMQGVPREEITPQMIRGLLEGVNNRAIVERVIDAEVAEIEAGH